MSGEEQHTQDLRAEVGELKAALLDAGIDIDQIRRQREEQEAAKKRREERFARRDREHAEREVADRAQALELWQEGVFVVDLNGKRLRAGKDLSVKCPRCRKELPAVGGWWLDFIGAYRQCTNGTTFHLLGGPSIGPPWTGIPGIQDSFTCPGCGEQIRVRMQMLLPTK